MEKKCPRCTMMVPEESVICPCCKKEFVSQSLHGSSGLSADKKCRYCAMMIPKDAKICPHCRKTQGWTWPAKIFAGLIVFGIIGSFIGKNIDYSHQNTPLPQGVTDPGQRPKSPQMNEVLHHDFTPPQGSISAKYLYNVYEANEIAADERFKGKTFEVYGIIGSIEKNIANQPYVSLDAGTLSFVNCRFSKDKISCLVSLEKGMMIVIEGTCSGKTVTSINLHDCELRSR